MIKIVSLLLASVACDEKSLRNSSKGTGIWVGTAMNQKHIKADSEYAQRAAKEYNLITSENACKMTNIAKSYSENDYSGCQFEVEFAKNNT